MASARPLDVRHNNLSYHALLARTCYSFVVCLSFDFWGILSLLPYWNFRLCIWFSVWQKGFLQTSFKLYFLSTTTTRREIVNILTLSHCFMAQRFPKHNDRISPLTVTFVPPFKNVSDPTLQWRAEGDNVSCQSLCLFLLYFNAVKIATVL